MIGQTISHYKIMEKLGEGGMGVVYKAQDTNLDRFVALKFLPAHLNASEQDKARFIQEAKAAAALNHPNVCSVIDIRDHDDQMFIVMEFVDGQTLRQKKDSISFKQAIDIGIQIADGLAAAHEKGIVHRDIKPENIMVRKDGIVQIMDFGLAKLKGVTRLTKEGSTVGTAGYMSPEQIQGQDADHRSDIFSLGVLLYEMLTGQLPFKGVHETAIAYEIVNVDATPMSVVKPETNPDLDRIVLECLEKEPSERFQSAAEIAKELKRYKRESSRQRTTRTIAARQFQKPTSGGELVSATARPAWKRFLWPSVSAILALALVLIVVTRGKFGGTQELPLMRFPINLSVSRALVLGDVTLAIAPDGKNMVYLANVEGSTQLYLRPLDQLEPRPIVGSDGASDPFFSGDGQWVGFFSNGKIKKASIFGGAIQDICDVPGFMRGGYWDDENSVWFGHLNSGIYRVPADGGTPAEVTILDTAAGEISHRFPQPLPGGDWVIFTVKLNNITSFHEALIVAENVETHERKELVRGGSWGRFVPTGHIMYARGKALYAVPFDLDDVETTGTPLPVVEGGMLNPLSGTANFEVSETGILIYTPNGPIPETNNVLAWIDRQENVTPVLSDPGPYANPKLSPDGSKIALTIRAANDDIWIYDLGRTALTRLTFGGGNSDLPLWSPDGGQVFFYSEQGRSIGIFRRSWDGSGGLEKLEPNADAASTFPATVSPDGKTLLASVDGDIKMNPVEGGPNWEPFIRSDAFEDGPSFSPDGRFLAYLSDESGRNEIYVVPYPKIDGKWQISTGGPSSKAIWNRQGRELFYAERDQVMKVDVSYEPRIHFSSPMKVCNLPPATFDFFDISPDGNKFLIIVSESQGIEATQVNVVVGWFGELRKKFASMQK